MPKTLFVGDVHGCADELGELLKTARPTRVILLGDLFTRGPDPAGVYKLIEKWNAEAVLGNHDETLLQSWKPGHRLPKRAFRWLSKAPHFVRGKGWVGVHAGIHPKKGLKRTTREQAMHMKYWKKDELWWKHYRGDDLVIHGHSRAHGLKRPHKQRSIGLDTGCVRGGKLTGFLLEKQRVISVDSTQPR